ncbi:CitMHS family transporter [Acutalibacter muris]|jgi:CitMHS family citrate-Mg2+:H+ or citrate-Ca2+:H+ symporter|uniref:CitMHS family transporter n=1 Tax=Acutalibacter muris TaxID=1796620 RepID=UPI0026F3F5F9|nr:citrate:proton symporter [Acutalibacter muris]
MLAFLGFLTVVLMLVLILAKKLTPTVALISVPLVTGLIACGFMVTDPENASGQVDFWANVQSISGMVTGASGIGSVAATGVMFLFSILFFGILTDAGTFQPIIEGIIKHMGSDPVLITLGTALLAMCVHLDGSGAVTFLICVPPLVPLYDAIGMKRTTLAATVAMAAGTMNILPWGGPTIRAASALGAGNDPVGFFLPVLPAVVVGLVSVLAFSALLGFREKSRIGSVALAGREYQSAQLSEEEQDLLRPKLFWVNISLIVLAIVCLLFSGFAPAVIFMVFYVLATVINYPNVEQSKARVDAHAQSAIMMCSVLFAAGCFCGIMKGSGMIDAMAKSLVSVMPDSLGRFFPLITGAISMPASLLFDPDSFYYGVLPILAETAKGFGIDPGAVGRAAILGQMTTGFPVSPLSPATFLLVGLSGVELGEHQKKTIPFAFALTIIMLLVAVLTGGVSL